MTAPGGFRPGRAKAVQGPVLRLRGIRDIEAHVWERMVTVCHVWPGLTPFNVWDLSLSGWLVFAAAADKWADARKESPRGG